MTFSDPKISVKIWGAWVRFPMTYLEFSMEFGGYSDIHICKPQLFGKLVFSQGMIHGFWPIAWLSPGIWRIFASGVGASGPLFLNLCSSLEGKLRDSGKNQRRSMTQLWMHEFHGFSMIFHCQLGLPVFFWTFSVYFTLMGLLLTWLPWLPIAGVVWDSFGTGSDPAWRAAGIQTST